MEKVSVHVPTYENLFYKLHRDVWWMGFRFWLRRNQWWMWLYVVAMAGLVAFLMVRNPRPDPETNDLIWYLAKVFLVLVFWYAINWSYRYYKYNRYLRSELDKHGLAFYDYILEFDDQGIAVISKDHRRDGSWEYVDHYLEKDDILHLFNGNQHFSFHAKGETGDDAYEALKRIVVEKCKPSKFR
jgi:hypothetical protein